MNVNVGSWDRFIRMLIGIGLLAITVIGPKTALGFIGFLPFLSAVVGWCPVYLIFGISTRERKDPGRSCPNCQ